MLIRFYQRKCFFFSNVIVRVNFIHILRGGAALNIPTTPLKSIEYKIINEKPAGEKSMLDENKKILKGRKIVTPPKKNK